MHVVDTHIITYNITIIQLYLRVLVKFTFLTIVSHSALKIAYLFYRSPTRLRENNNLPLWRASAIKKKPLFF